MSILVLLSDILKRNLSKEEHDNCSNTKFWVVPLPLAEADSGFLIGRRNIFQKFTDLKYSIFRVYLNLWESMLYCILFVLLDSFVDRKVRINSEFAKTQTFQRREYNHLYSRRWLEWREPRKETTIIFFGHQSIAFI